jgi:hypothetical protein
MYLLQLSGEVTHQESIGRGRDWPVVAKFVEFLGVLRAFWLLAPCPPILAYVDVRG